MTARPAPPDRSHDGADGTPAVGTLTAELLLGAGLSRRHVVATLRKELSLTTGEADAAVAEALLRRRAG